MSAKTKLSTKPKQGRQGAAGDDLAFFARAVSDRIELVATSALKPAKAITRTHKDEQIALIMGSFRTFGIINPLIVDESHTILSGHARWEAARRLGIETLPVVAVAHLTPDEKRAYAIADNRIAEKAGWDTEILKSEFEYLSTIDFDFDLDVLGFSVGEIDLVIEGSGEAKTEPDPADAIPPLVASAVTKPGDVWRLGRHRLLCGSALDPAVYDTLMQGQSARMILTDPPYNVAIDGFVGGLGSIKHREFAMASGEMSEAEFINFLTTAITLTSNHLMNGGLGYWFIDWRHGFELQSAARAVGLKHHNLCVWDKMSGGMGSHYRSQHELCHIFKKGDAPHLNTVELGRHGRYRTNVWSHRGMSSFGAARQQSLASHPTVKPVALLAEAIKDCTRRGDLVLDGFLGSGSTLIAAQKSGRTCYGIELDPLYCDLIVRRYQDLTGDHARHEATGQSFADLSRAQVVKSEPTVPTDGEAIDA